VQITALYGSRVLLCCRATKTPPHRTISNPMQASTTAFLRVSHMRSHAIQSAKDTTKL
jgi:hypothetical protein